MLKAFRPAEGEDELLPEVHEAVFRRMPKPWMRSCVSVVFMLALAIVVYLFKIPNPNMILISGLVVCSALFGYAGGIFAAVIMLGYTLFFFSDGHDLVTFTSENLRKVCVSTLGTLVVTGFVCVLEQSERQAIHQLTHFAQVLKEDNALLSQVSTIDTLTGIRNRFSLREDYDVYATSDQQMLVAMIDLDDFKEFNDTYGHETGDYILSQIGKELQAIFGQEHSYRYGGDEFLLVLPSMGSSEFEGRFATLREHMERLELDGRPLPVHVSVGYVEGRPVLSGDLRLMLRQADGELYESKRGGKDRVSGAGFSRVA